VDCELQQELEKVLCVTQMHQNQVFVFFEELRGSKRGED
jgi:hypothetical protein